MVSNCCVDVSSAPRLLGDAPSLMRYMEQRLHQLETQSESDKEARAPSDPEFYLDLLRVAFEPELRQNLIEELERMGVPKERIERASRAGVDQLREQYDHQRTYLPLDLWIQINAPTGSPLEAR